MHTFVSSDGRYSFTSNSDLSGGVVIEFTDKYCRELGIAVDDSRRLSLTVQGSALIEFIGNFVRDERIRALEQMSARGVLGSSGVK